MSILAPNIYVVDDDDAFRDSLALILRLKGFAPLTFASGEEFLSKVAAAPSGCLLIDMQMSGMSGLAVQQELINRGITLPTIVITAYGDVATARAALKSGAIDFLEKPLDEEALDRIIRTALDVGAEAAARATAAADLAARLSRLTDREREVLDMVVAGRHNREVAVDLGISPRTVEVYKARMMEKMRVSRIPDLIRLVLTGERPG